MKNFIIPATVIAGCFLLSFTVRIDASEKKGYTAALSDTVKNSQSTMGRQNTMAVYKGIETGDLSVMDKFVSKDIVDHGGPQDVKGLENVKKMLADIHNHFSSLKLTLISDAVSADGMYHFALGRMTGTTKDATMGLPANTPVDRMSVDVVRIENGMAVEHWSFDDPREMMKMMQMKKK
ncbi:ester cyclase [Flavihumibacter sp. R14]|nr:ester cyclase [Flavihumibacter soli]